jgi:hypothetical protein
LCPEMQIVALDGKGTRYFPTVFPPASLTGWWRSIMVARTSEATREIAFVLVIDVPVLPLVAPARPFSDRRPPPVPVHPAQPHAGAVRGNVIVTTRWAPKASPPQPGPAPKPVKLQTRGEIASRLSLAFEKQHRQ